MRNHWLRRGGAAGVLAAAIIAGGAGVSSALAQEKGEPNPAAYYRDVMANGRLKTSGTGEDFCWNASAGAELFLTAYIVYHDPRWLEEGSKYFDFYISKLQKDPDGYEGWIGDPIARNGSQLSTDAIVGDSILCAPLAHFVEIVRKDPALQAQFGKTADRYLALVTRIMWDKWNQRGCYDLDAAGWGSYHTPGKLIDLKTDKWVDTPSEMISDNLNKHYAAGIVFLRLWRATGNERYKQRVIQIFSRAKSMWRYYPEGDRIVWNYWMPHGPYDMVGRAPKSWVGVHPDRSGYQAWEVNMFVEVYDSGLVFDRQDFERMIRTNHWMADGPGGTWRNADGTSAAGELWTGFARFDDQIRAKTEAEWSKPGIENQVQLAYLKYVMAKAPGWQRLYVTDPSKIEVTKMPLQPGENLTMTVVIPDVLEVADDGRVQLATETRTAGKLKFELLDASGKEDLGTIKEIDVGNGGEFNAPFWDGTNPKTGKKDLGEYQIRWTLGNESRTQPVWVKEGTAHKHEGLAAIEPGRKLSVDFESPLDQRWTTEQAVLSTDRAHSGKHSLKVSGTASFHFGRTDNLPVKITMWVYDSGAEFGAANHDGPAWGITTAMGDKFCVREDWRRYLDGDNTYAWVNTGENQWFSPHPGAGRRQKGWVEWVFDFSDPKHVTVSCGGEKVRGLSAKFTPGGAVGVYLLNGDSGGPLYVDDVTVEYPAK